MSGLISILSEIYIRFMVWLGAAPPPGYEYLVPAETGPREYTLKEGETLFSVARKFGIHYDRIARANAIDDPKTVQSGQTLVIPPDDWDPSSGPLAQLQPQPEPATEMEEFVPPVIFPEPTEEPLPATAEEPDRFFEAEEPEPIPEEPEWLRASEPPSEAEAVDEALSTGEGMVERERLERLVAAEPPPSTEALPSVAETSSEEASLARTQVELPVGEPAPEAAPETRPARVVPEEEMVFRYEVQRGDTMTSIARRYGVTIKELIEANDITDPSFIFPGQKIIIPGYMSPRPQPRVGPEPKSRVEPAAQPAVEIDASFPPIGPMEAVRGLYVSYFAVGHTELRRQIFELLDTTELNAVVIDAKGDYGWISYPTQVSLAHEIDAARPTAKDFDEVMAQLKARGVYTIARVVTFKDNLLARCYPELAIKIQGNGQMWQDQEQQSWCDPFLKPVWDYNVQVAVEAAQKGFDEIQFDYVRFPTASRSGAPQFSQEITRESRIAAITSFLSVIRGQLQPFGVKVAADTFGYTCWRRDDTLVGQDIERLGHYLDVLSPMLYPSTFGSGIPGYKFAVAHPYEVVYESARRAVERVNRFGCIVRPWIQDFPDYRFDRRVYGREEIQAQIRGCFDAGSAGFMVWNPNVRYSDGAYAPVVSHP